jgi:NADPH:quinone reductase-like Zn-dependent oxidoreductase
MKRLVLKKYSLKAFSLENVEPPQCAVSGDVQIHVSYAGISFTDAIITLGMYQYQRTHAPLPQVLGFEFSGIVTETRSQHFSKGDRVCGVTRFGAFQEVIVVRDAYVVAVPDTMHLSVAAALPVNIVTALHAASYVTPHAKKVLVFGASGGVGAQLIRVLKRAGLYVTGVTSNESKKEYVRAHGADVVTTRALLTTQSIPETFDVIFLNDGTQSALHLRRLSPRGVLVVYGFHGVVATGLKKILRLAKYWFTTSVSIGNLVYNNHSVAGFNLIHFLDEKELIEKRMQQLSDVIVQGGYGHVSVHECTLQQIDHALNALLAGDGVGKWVVRMTD